MKSWACELTFILLAAVGLLTACTSADEADVPSPPLSMDEDLMPTSPPPTEDRDFRYNQLLGRDSIRPVYEPEFVPADQAPLDDEELVLGIEIDGEAKAYPISVLNFREMVNDELAGVPILATW